MKSPRILIVDDSSVMRKIVEGSLRRAGLEIGDVVEAGNGVEALAAVREGAFGLIRWEDYELVTISDGDQIQVGLSYESSSIWFCLAFLNRVSSREYQFVSGRGHHTS